MNISVLTGNLTKDAEIKVTNSGKKVARFSMAVRNGGTDKSDFFNCVAWEKRAEFIENGMKDGRYLTGCEVEVKGQFHNVSFDSTDPQTGAPTKVKYDELTIEESFSRRHKNWQGGQQAPQGGYAAPAPQGGYQQPQRGGYQPQGGYTAPAAQPQGGYQAAQPQGGYASPAPQPQQPQGGYQATPQAQQRGGYQPAPQPQPQAGYQAAPPAPQPQPQGVQTGSFQQIPAQNAAPAPTAQAGGFKAAAVNAPRTGQGTYGGYPEGAGYGN